MTISTACAGANRMPGYELRQALIDLAAIAEQIADELPAAQRKNACPAVKREAGPPSPGSISEKSSHLCGVRREEVAKVGIMATPTRR